jgi:carbamoyltransferase
MVGATRRDVDVLALTRSDFPVQYFHHFRGYRWIREHFRTYIQGKKTRFIPRETRRANTMRDTDFFDANSFARDSGFRDDVVVYFYNHHKAHSLPTLFYTDWDDALMITADGGGDNINHSRRRFINGQIEEIYGGDEWLRRDPPIDSLGQAYAAATRALGFRDNRHEGKLTGLSAMGEPVFAEQIGQHFRVDEAGKISSDFPNNTAIFRLLAEIAKQGSREDVAASIQKVLEDTMLLSVGRLLKHYPARHLGVAGGVFANVRLNRALAEQLDFKEIFVFPPMGDEGLPIGGSLVYLLQRDGMAHWLKQRRRLNDVYFGRDYTDTADATLSAIPGLRRLNADPIEQTAKRLAAGEIGAIYTGRMEYGPRALGARSILANPSRRETHDLLNTRLDRTEFMPFAPVIAADRASEVFDVSKLNAYACRFMTITCNVRPNWRNRIPAVVHVDGSARPQTIVRESNPLYFDILTAFEKATGIPVLVNTSFNVHEEPIVNTPRECAQALLDRRIDFVVTKQAIYEAAAT